MRITDTPSMKAITTSTETTDVAQSSPRNPPWGDRSSAHRAYLAVGRLDAQPSVATVASPEPSFRVHSSHWRLCLHDDVDGCTAATAATREETIRTEGRCGDGTARHTTEDPR